MSNLIITLISIALIGIVAVSTLFFGGDAFNKGSAKANANTVISQASQIDSANTLHFLDKQANAADVNALVAGTYLASVPSPGSVVDGGSYVLDAANGSVELSGVPVSVCEKINEVAGLDGVVVDTQTDIDTAGTNVVSEQDDFDTAYALDDTADRAALDAALAVQDAIGGLSAVQFGCSGVDDAGETTYGFLFK